MNILIVGAGSVGLGLASFLADAGGRPVLVARSGTAKLLTQEGLRRDGILGARSVPAHRLRVVERVAEIHDVVPEIICICTKAFDNDEVVQQLSEWPLIAGRSIPILLFQNGWGGHIPLVARFGQERIFNARVITGFAREAPNHVRVTVHADAIHVGSLYRLAPVSPVRELVNLLNANGLATCLVDDVAKDVWAKLFYNCVLNSLGAVLDVPYGVLGEEETTRQIMADIAQEGFAVMTRLSYQTHWQDCAGFLEAFYSTMLPPTAAHISSTLQDIRRGARTEIDFLNGAIVSEGLRLGVPTPVNTTICQLVRFIQRRSRRLSSIVPPA